jgi:hypothetical protein
MMETGTGLAAGTLLEPMTGLAARTAANPRPGDAEECRDSPVIRLWLVTASPTIGELPSFQLLRKVV